MQISVIGTGYVGLVTGACLASLGNQVTCVDNDNAKMDRLWRGEIPIYEPGLDDLVAEARDQDRLTFTTQLAEAVRRSEVIFICVGTPPGSDGQVDLSQVESVAREIGATLEDGYKVIVNKSTVPVGSGDWVRMLIDDGIRERRCAGTQVLAGTAAAGPDESVPNKPMPAFDVVSNPEFLREGSAIQDMLHPDRIVVGSDSPRALDVMRQLYAPIVEQASVRDESRSTVPFIETDLASAEMIKYAANAFLATKISFINEIANICERVGAHVGQVAHGIGLDERIGRQFLSAGIGWGGSCFGKDVSALARMAADYGYEARILHAVQEVNAHQRQWVVQKLQERLKVLKGKTVGLMGLAFKPETDDVRDSPALTIAQRLLALGVKVRGLDPVAGPNAIARVPGLILAPNGEALAEGADALVLVTDWPQFAGLDYRLLRTRMRHPTLIDARNFLDGAALEALGFDYLAIGQ